MTTTLTGQVVQSSYSQILHVDGGLTGATKTVYDGDGTASALKVSTGAASVDNVQIDGNTISTLDTNGNLILAPNGSGSVEMTKVAITGGTISGITDLPVADGGTGASTASGARTNLGLGTMATQDATNVAVTGGSVVVSTLGYKTGAGGAVTQATSRSTAVTLNTMSGKITLVAGTIAANAADVFTLNNSNIAADDVVVVSIRSGLTASERKYYTCTVVAVAAGSCDIAIGNHSSGTIPAAGSDSPVINFAVIKAASS